MNKLFKYTKFIFAFLFVLSVMVSSCFASSDQPKPIKLQLKWRNQFQFAGYYAAKIKGYYKQNGLDVKILPGGPGISPVSNVLNGKADIGVFDPGILLKYHKEKPLIVLATIMQSSAYCIISLKSKNILKPADLVGKRVLVEHDQGWSVFKAILLKEGIDVNTIKLVERKKDSEEIITNDADAVVTYITSQPQRIRSLGYEINIMRPEEYGVDFYGDVLFTTRAYAYHDKQQTDAFINASLKGWKYALAHQDELIDYILTLPDVKTYGVTKKHLKYEAKQVEKLIMPQLVEIGHTNLGRWQYMLTLFKQLGVADMNYSLKHFIYDSEENQLSQWIVPIIYVAVCIFILIIGVVLINLQLRKSVKLKTAELSAEIEQRKIAEQIANENKEQIELILNSSNIGLWELHISNEKTWFNQEFKKILGYPDHYHFKEQDLLQKIHPEDVSFTEHLFRTKEQDGTSKKMIQFRIENANKEYIHVLSSSKLLYQNNKPFKISGVLLSINELKKKEQEILKVSEELVKRNNELKKFAYITSHNLRGPVVNISVLSGMIDRDLLDADNAVIFDKITESIARLETTLNDLIEVVSQEQAQNCTVAIIDIEKNIKSIIQSIENQIIDTGTSFNFDLQLKNIAYPQHYFDSIILNLVTNAIKYKSPLRKPVITIKSFEAGDYDVLQFQDNGMGIDLPKNQSKIFGLYQRFNPEIQGKGIGLFIIKSHMESLNGKVDVKSELGSGTTFILYFPKSLKTVEQSDTNTE